jgi:DNA primase
MALDKDITQQILQNADIVSVIQEYLSLKKAGNNHKGLCPFHKENTPSFVVSEEKQIFHCFGCHAGGDVITFVMKIENLSFKETVYFLAEKFGIKIDSNFDKGKYDLQNSAQNDLFKINSRIADYYHSFLEQSANSANARKYLKDRGFTDQDVLDFNLGFAPDTFDSVVNNAIKNRMDLIALEKLGIIKKNKISKYNDFFRNRIIFPIKDSKGRVIAFGGRVMDDSLPKYLNSPETEIFKKNASLYGIDIAVQHIKEQKRILILEGYIDVISLHRAGIKNSVATLGTALTDNHITLIKRYTDEIILIFDGDEAGVKASLRSVDLFVNSNFYVKIVLIPEKLDPDDYLQKYGKDKFLELVNNAQDAFFYKLNFLAKKRNFSKLEDREKFLLDSFEMILNIDNKIRLDFMLKIIADFLKEKEENVLFEFNKYKKSKQKTLTKQKSVVKELEKGEEKLSTIRIEQDFLEFLILKPHNIKNAINLISIDWIQSEQIKLILNFLFANQEILKDKTSNDILRFVSSQIEDENIREKLHRVFSKVIISKDVDDNVEGFRLELEIRYLKSQMDKLIKSDKKEDILEYYNIAKKLKAMRSTNEKQEK